MSRILDPGAVGSIPGHMEARWISVDFIHRELLAIAAWKEDAIARFSMGRIKKGGGLAQRPFPSGALILLPCLDVIFFALTAVGRAVAVATARS